MGQSRHGGQAVSLGMTEAEDASVNLPTTLLLEPVLYPN
jgi:hypothetical protein